MARKIAVFADGTGNTVHRHDSNVLQLCRMLDLSDEYDQVAIYDPGVGTTASVGELRAVLGSSPRMRLVEDELRRSWPMKIGRIVFGCGFGWGTDENIRQLYGGLIEEYRPGAEIYLFGFSRGALTARALAGLVYRCGVPKRNDADAIDEAMCLYRKHYEACRNDTELRQLKLDADKFRRDRSHSCNIRFLGIWDTVKAVGYFWPKNLPHTRHNPIVQTVRHAVSLSERRSFYAATTWGGLDADTRPALYVPSDPQQPEPPIAWQNVQEVWFAGDHSDVGGGRKPGDNILANVSLHWMINEAHDHDLRVCPDRYRKFLESVPDNARLGPGAVHDEMKRNLGWAVFWRALDYAPRRDLVNEPPPPKRPVRVLCPAGPRKLAPTARRGVVAVHSTAQWCYRPDQAPWKGAPFQFVETTERVGGK